MCCTLAETRRRIRSYEFSLLSLRDGPLPYERRGVLLSPAEINFLRCLQLAVRDTLARLTEAERQAIELRMEGYEVAEIADAVGRSKRTVERSLQQARSKLKALFDEGVAP